MASTCIDSICRVIPAISVCISVARASIDTYLPISVNKAPCLRVVVAAVQVIKPGLDIVVIASVAKRVSRTDCGS